LRLFFDLGPNREVVVTIYLFDKSSKIGKSDKGMKTDLSASLLCCHEVSVQLSICERHNWIVERRKEYVGQVKEGWHIC
jgi:hypothetical protein